MEAEDPPFLPKALLAFAAVGEGWCFHLLARGGCPFRRWVGLAAFALAVFAGIAQLLRMRGLPRRRAALKGVAPVGIAVLALLLVLGLPPGWSAQRLSVLGVVLTLLALSA